MGSARTMPSATWRKRSTATSPTIPPLPACSWPGTRPTLTTTLASPFPPLTLRRSSTSRARPVSGAGFVGGGGGGGGGCGCVVVVVAGSAVVVGGGDCCCCCCGGGGGGGGGGDDDVFSVLGCCCGCWWGFIVVVVVVGGVLLLLLLFFFWGGEGLGVLKCISLSLQVGSSKKWPPT